MNCNKIKKLLEIKRYAELTEEEIRVIEECIGKNDGFSESLFTSIEYDKMLAKIKNNEPVLQDPERLTLVIMDSIESKDTQAYPNSIIEWILDVINSPGAQFAFKSLLVLIFCFFFFEEISFTSDMSNLENRYYTESVSAAGVESIIKNEVSLINKLQGIYELIMDEKDYMEISDDWLVMQRSEQKRIISYYLSYMLGNKYEEKKLLKALDSLDNINFLDGLNENEIKVLEKHKHSIQNEINKILRGGKNHE